MWRKSFSRLSGNSRVLLLLAGLLAAIIFALDTVDAFRGAVAVLYVVVVLLAASAVRGRAAIVSTSLACAALTIFSFLITHGLGNFDAALSRCLMSLSAIAVTTVLIIKHQSASTALAEKAELLDLTHDSIFVRNMDDVITYWNRGAEGLYGWSAEHALGSPCHQLMQTVFPYSLDEIRQELLSTGRWEGELVHTKRDGSTVTVSSRWSLNRNDQGKPMAVLETNTDITERKRAEAKVLRQERELRRVIDTVPGMVWSASAADGSLEFVSKRWEELGLSLENVVGPKWRTIIHPDDLPQMEMDWGRSLATGDAFENISRVRRSDGQYRWLLLRATLLRDEHGNPVKWYGVNTDIEDHKRAEYALRRSQAHLTVAQALSQTGSISFNSASKEFNWSAEAARISGEDPAITPTIESILRHVHPDDVALVNRERARARDGQHLDFECRLLMPDGSTRYLHVVANTSRDALGNAEVICAVMNVTDAKEAEHALQEAHAKLAHVTRLTTLGQLTASIAHEVNQPLAGVVLNGDVCLRWINRDTPDLDEVRSALERIIADARRASDIVRRIRSLSRNSELTMTPVDVNEIVNEALMLVQREIFTNRVTLRLNLTNDPSIVLGDRVQLQQVLINLLINGIQAMGSIDNGLRELVVTTLINESDQVNVTIRDSGPGIDPESAPRLFDAFFTTKANGMGMGLSICRSIIEAHRGRIWAVPSPCRGAIFQMALPRAEKDARP